MQISPINLLNKNNKTNKNSSKKQVNFKRADYLFELKTIPNITCSCCGKKILNPQEMSQIWNKISRPLNSVLDKDIFAYWKDFFPEIYKKLLALGERYPNKTLNAIFLEPDEFENMKRDFVEIVRKEKDFGEDDHKNVDKPARKLMETLMKTASGYLKSSDEVFDVLKNYESYLTGDQLEAYEQLKKYSKSNPGYRLSHLVQQYEVMYYHQKRNQAFETNIQERFNECYGNIHKIIKSQDSEGKIDIAKLNIRAYKILSQERDPIIRIAKVKEFYTNFLKKHDMEKIVPDVIEQVDKLPEKYRNADSFFVRAYQCGYNDGSIVGSIFEPFIARNINIETREYPRVESIFNRIITCTSCAQRKSAGRSYAEYGKYHNEIYENTDKTFNMINDYVSHRPYLSDIVKSYERQAKSIIEENTNLYNLKKH